MLTAIDLLLVVLVTTVPMALTGVVAYLRVKSKYIQPLTGLMQTIPARVGKQIGSSIEKAAEGLDIGALAGQVGGGSGGMEGLGAISGLLGGGGGGLGDLIGLLGQFSGQKTKKGVHNPGK